MSEEFVTRTEHSRSIEDAERHRALHTLQEVGLLIPVADLETFHGRLGTVDEPEWTVNPAFANGGNASGNGNVNKRPTLYTGERQLAQDFARERGRDTIRTLYEDVLRDRVRRYTPAQKQDWLGRVNAKQRDWWEGQSVEQRRLYQQTGPTVYTLDQLDQAHLVNAEVMELEARTPDAEKEALWKGIAKRYRAEAHEIVTADADAAVLDFDFDETKLDASAREKYRHALQTLVLSVTEGSPVDFRNRDTARPFVETVLRHQKFIVSNDEVAELAAEAGVDERVGLQLASAYNARQIAYVQPGYLVSELLKQPTEIFTANLGLDGESQEVPLNLEYVQRYLREAHIVGVKQSVNSVTVGKLISSVSFFDLEKTTTAKSLEVARAATWKRLGSMATALGQSVHSEAQRQQPLLRLLEDAHAKPDKLVAAAKLVDGYEALFDGDAGNWEGFTLGEHTETVLRNFDENYADKLPVEFLAPMRLAILAHDVGKPIAAAHGERHRQKEYNVAQADDFLGRLGVDERLKGLLLAVVGDGAELAFQIQIRGAGEPAELAMKELATRTLGQFYGSENISDEEINGFIEICNMLQISDGGAYTSMAITRGAKGRYRNAPSFNASFAQPVGFGRRAIRLREAGSAGAANDLTPQASRHVSRLKIAHRGAGRRAPQMTTPPKP